MPFYVIVDHFMHKKCIYFLEFFFNCNILKIGAFMYSQTCIEWSSSGDGVPQNKSNIKNNKKCHFMS